LVLPNDKYFRVAGAHEVFEQRETDIAGIGERWDRCLGEPRAGVGKQIRAAREAQEQIGETVPVCVQPGELKTTQIELLAEAVFHRKELRLRLKYEMTLAEVHHDV